MNVQEMLARAWIECDPNRAGSGRGSGFHADDPLDFGTLKDEPRWKWFLPRAEALQAYIERHGFRIVPAEDGA